MSESNINVTPGSGGPNIDLELVDNGNARQVICIGDPTTSANVATVDASGNQKVSVSNFPATQPISAVSLPLPTGAALDSTLQTILTSITSIVQLRPSDQCQSVTAATGVGVTATLPAAAGNFHYITGILITKYFTAANTASATPLVVTTTNLPGSLALSFGQPLGTIGTTDVREDIFGFPLKSAVVNTATTIVAPATTGIIWRINVFYYVAP